MMEERYPYKPKLLAAIVTVVFFGVLAGFMGFFSLDNDQGLVLNGIIHFSRMGATIFYWVITLVLAAFSVLGLLLIFKSLTSKGELIITDQYVRAPKSGISKRSSRCRLMTWKKSRSRKSKVRSSSRLFTAKGSSLLYPACCRSGRISNTSRNISWPM
ncbi:hypothetical protein HML84_11600 [Alcanivorax sp. IO_7]|nr:hypothetical protein HML84_11600 [Alcanivorax sp. IO_7]